MKRSICQQAVPGLFRRESDDPRIRRIVRELILQVEGKEICPLQRFQTGFLIRGDIIDAGQEGRHGIAVVQRDPVKGPAYQIHRLSCVDRSQRDHLSEHQDKGVFHREGIAVRDAAAVFISEEEHGTAEALRLLPRRCPGQTEQSGRKRSGVPDQDPAPVVKLFDYHRACGFSSRGVPAFRSIRPGQRKDLKSPGDLYVVGGFPGIPET